MTYKSYQNMQAHSPTERNKSATHTEDKSNRKKQYGKGDIESK